MTDNKILEVIQKYRAHLVSVEAKKDSSKAPIPEKKYSGIATQCSEKWRNLYWKEEEKRRLDGPVLSKVVFGQLENFL